MTCSFLSTSQHTLARLFHLHEDDHSQQAKISFPTFTCSGSRKPVCQSTCRYIHDLAPSRLYVQRTSSSWILGPLLHMMKRIESAHSLECRSCCRRLYISINPSSTISCRKMHTLLGSRMISMSEYIFHGTTVSSYPARFALVQRSRPTLDGSPSSKLTRSRSRLTLDESPLKPTHIG